MLRAMTLKELASLLGLSATTVSRALNGYPEVGPRRGPA
jgi:LacI family transcriptional regulator